MYSSALLRATLRFAANKNVTQSVRSIYVGTKPGTARVS
jgi:hypothetical protein